MGGAHFKMGTSMYIAETKNQMRRAISPCGGEKAGKSAELGEAAKEGKGEVRFGAPMSEIKGAGVTNGLKSASVEWSPLQQMWLESGMFGVTGACSWHPESLCVSSCTFATAGRLTVQETCNNSAVTAANAATLPANLTIERMPMRSSENDTNTSNSIVPAELLVLHKSSVLSL
jgi:hypothetical protein